MFIVMYWSASRVEIKQLENVHSSLEQGFHSWFVNGIKKKVSFKLGKEIEKHVYRHVTSVEQSKYSESPLAFIWLLYSEDIFLQ